MSGPSKVFNCGIYYITTPPQEIPSNDVMSALITLSKQITYGKLASNCPHPIDLCAQFVKSLAQKLIWLHLITLQTCSHSCVHSQMSINEWHRKLLKIMDLPSHVLLNFKHKPKENMLLLPITLKKLTFTQHGFDLLGTFATMFTRLWSHLHPR